VLFKFKKISRMIDFLVDTGAKLSAITEKEAIIMRIDTSSLPYSKHEAVGFGGSFKIRMINRLVILTFKSNKDEYKIRCSNFLVNCIPPQLKGEEREKMIRYTPNVLGMDVLRRFRVCIDKNIVELTIKP